jgi:hypothetical protein
MFISITPEGFRHAARHGPLDGPELGLVLGKSVPEVHLKSSIDDS